MFDSFSQSIVDSCLKCLLLWEFKLHDDYPDPFFREKKGNSAMNLCVSIAVEFSTQR